MAMQCYIRNLHAKTNDQKDARSQLLVHANKSSVHCHRAVCDAALTDSQAQPRKLPQPK